MEDKHNNLYDLFQNDQAVMLGLMFGDFITMSFWMETKTMTMRDLLANIDHLFALSNTLLALGVGTAALPVFLGKQTGHLLIPKVASGLSALHFLQCMSACSQVEQSADSNSGWEVEMNK